MVVFDSTVRSNFQIVRNTSNTVFEISISLIITCLFASSKFFKIEVHGWNRKLGSDLQNDRSKVSNHHAPIVTSVGMTWLPSTGSFRTFVGTVLTSLRYHRWHGLLLLVRTFYHSLIHLEGLNIAKKWFFARTTPDQITALWVTDNSPAVVHNPGIRQFISPRGASDLSTWDCQLTVI